MTSDSGRALGNTTASDGEIGSEDIQEGASDDPFTGRASSMRLRARIVTTDDVEMRRCRTRCGRSIASPLLPFSSSVSLRARFFVGDEGTGGAARIGLGITSSSSCLHVKVFVVVGDVLDRACASVLDATAEMRLIDA